MYLINHVFQKEVIKTITNTHIVLEHDDVKYIFNLLQNGAMFFDENNHCWVFAANDVTFFDENEKEIKLEQGQTASFNNGERFTRAYSLNEVDEKATEYFLPYIIKHQPDSLTTQYYKVLLN